MNDVRLLLHPSDQPVFRLLADARGCSAEVRINDVPVWANTGGAAARVMLSINEWLFAGENTVELWLTPLPDMEAPPGSETILSRSAAVETMLLCKKNRAPWLAQQEVMPLNYTHREDFRNVGLFNTAPHDHDHAHSHGPEEPEPASPAATPAPGPVAAPIMRPGEQTGLTCVPVPADWLPGGGGIRLGMKFTLPAVWPACPWARAAELAGMGGLDYTAKRLALSLADALQRRDWNTLRRLFADRRAALQAAYYLSDPAADEALAFPRLLQPADSKVEPVADEVQATLCGGGRLLRLPPVTLTCPAQQCAAEIESFWLHTGHEWRMVR